MKKLRQLFLAVIFFGCLIMAGCGANVNNNIVINKDGSGERSIVAEISNDDMTKVKGGKDALESTLKTAMPKELTMEEEEGVSSIKYVFKYTFKDFNEYKEKTKAITGKYSDAYFKVSDGLFNKKCEFSETAIEKDLLKWATDAINNAKLIDESEGSEGELINIRSTHVNLCGLEKDSFGDINIKDNKSYDFESINIDTKALGGDKYSRSITYLFPSETMSELSKDKALENKMKKLVPSGGKLKKVTKGESSGFTIDFGEITSIDELNSKTHKASLDKKSVFSLKKLQNTSILEPQSNFTDSINFINLTEGVSVKKGIYYTYDGGSKYTLDSVMGYKIPENSKGSVNLGFNTKVKDSKNISMFLRCEDNLKVNAVLHSSSYFVITIFIIIAILVLAAAAFFGLKIFRKMKNTYETSGTEAIVPEAISGGNKSFCNNCGNELANDAKFCTVCGTEIMKNENGFLKLFKRIGECFKKTSIINMKNSGVLKDIVIGAAAALCANLVISILYYLIFGKVSSEVIQRFAGRDFPLTSNTLKFYDMMFFSLVPGMYCKAAASGNSISDAINGSFYIPSLIMLVLSLIGLYVGMKIASRNTDKRNKREIFKRNNFLVLIYAFAITILSLIFVKRFSPLGNVFGFSLSFKIGYSPLGVFFSSIFYGLILSSYVSFRSLGKTTKELLGDSLSGRSFQGVFYGILRALPMLLILYVVMLIVLPFIDPKGLGGVISEGFKSSYGLRHILLLPNVLIYMLNFSFGASFKTTGLRSMADLVTSKTDANIGLFAGFSSCPWYFYFLIIIGIATAALGTYYIINMKREKLSIIDVLSYAAANTFVLSALSFISRLSVNIRVDNGTGFLGKLFGGEKSSLILSCFNFKSIVIVFIFTFAVSFCFSELFSRKTKIM